MKEASGELNMTLVTIVAIAAVAGLFYLLYPRIRDAINDRWDDTAEKTPTDLNEGINSTN